MTKRYTARHRATAPAAHSRPALRTVAGLGLSIGTVVAGVSVAQADPAEPAVPASAGTADLSSTPVDTSPLPSDADGLLDRLNEISRQAEATSDRVEENRTALDSARTLLDRSNAALDYYTRESDEAVARAEAARGPVTELSQSLYRGATVDPVTAAIGSASPQDAIDRSAYGSALNATRTATVENLQTSLSDAAASKSLALRSKATADFQLSEFGQRQADLDARTAELDAMKDQISEAVDAMPQDQKQRWIDRNGPIDVDVEEFLNEASALAGGVVGAAMSKLGSPYSWGATGPDAFDCSGLMFWAYQQMGKSIPRTSSAQIAGGTPVSREQLQPGDIVGYYSGVSHVGMYIGDGKIVHASDYGIPVQVVSVDSMPFAGASRY
ncbi:NlpC/P60 family protein [Corynebacterium variabile]|uniref:NlpC/P60 family protein n=1 Tax=Corynebacterium variabile TaxID=1727 RepID=UPI00289D2C1F|nr:NlpC/P60 family protein [Corynebacterium variabile]